MLRTFFSVLLLVVTTTVYGQPTFPACNLDYGPTIQILSGVYTFSTATCTATQPDAFQVIPFPTGSPTTQYGWMNIEASYGTIGPLGDQPDLYVVCGKDQFNEHVADFNITNIGAQTFGGLHVGWITPAGSFGKDLDIYCTDSLMLKELWVVEGATVNIYGPVFITEDAHNAGTINIMEGGSLTFLVDREKHQHSLFENRGTVNGRISYESLYMDGPIIAPFGVFVDDLPSSFLDTVDPFLADLEYSEWLEYYVDNYAIFEASGSNANEPIIGVGGYYMEGIPLQGVRLNAYDGDMIQKERFKGWGNNSGLFITNAGPQEDLGVSAPASFPGLFTLIGIENGDTTFFDSNDPDSYNWLADTALVNDGFFMNIETVFDVDVWEEDEALMTNADSLTWVPFGNTPLYGFYTSPNGAASTITWFDLRTGSSEGNPIWNNPNHSIIADTIGTHPWNISWGDPLPTVAYNDSVNGYNFAELYPPGFRMDSWTTELARNKYARFMPIDANTPIHQPIGLWRGRSGHRYTPVIWEYEGYPWFNSSAGNDGQYYPSIPYENQVIPVYDNGIDNGVQLYMPTSPGITYFYNTEGDLFEYSAFTDCLINNDTLYCFANTESYDMTQLGSFTPTVIQGSGFGSEVQTITGAEQANMWTSFSNPSNGYLDLDLVAERYFDENSEAIHLEFAWYNLGGNQDFYYAEHPQQEVYTATQVGPYQRRYFRRKYHKYGNEVYASELDFWIQLVVDYAVANPGLQNDLITTFITDYNDDGVINSEVALNYLAQDTLNPFSYYPLGRYLTPSGSIWVKNSQGQEAQLNMSTNEAVYDFHFPENVPGYDVAGDEWLDGLRLAGDSANITVVAAIDFKNDSSYWPRPWFHHVWDLEAENGIQPLEDDMATTTGYPFLCSDSSSFYPASYVYEATPHNADPLLGIIPKPDSAICITPLQFQESPASAMNQQAPFDRLGIRVHQSADTVIYLNGDTIVFNDTIMPIKYVFEGDTMWFRHRDYAYPVTVELFFTSLRGDVTGDGIVNVNDLTAFLNYYGACDTDVPVVPNLQDYDINGDGCVNAMDHLWVIVYFQTSLHFNGNFSPQSIAEAQLSDAEVLQIYPTDARNEPGVTIGANQLIRIPGEEIFLYDTNLDLIAQERNEVTAPLQQLYIIATSRFAGHIDFRIP